MKYKMKEKPLMRLSEVEREGSRTFSPTFSRLIAPLLLAGVVFTTLFTPVGSDELTTQEQQARESAYHQSQNKIAQRVKRLSEAELEEVIDSLNLSAKEVENLRLATKKGLLEFVKITLWDDMAEDGDRVQISSSQKNFDVLLTNSPRQIIIPVHRSEREIQIKGIYDGGGGITIAFKTEDGQVGSPELRPGDVLFIPS